MDSWLVPGHPPKFESPVVTARELGESELVVTVGRYLLGSMVAAQAHGHVRKMHYYHDLLAFFIHGM